ncbi:GTA-gp10 family protein [Tardiphaga sp.]|jgi:hypothetical protein|uniref:GTA-gp10 family protein n=1 Tax=Tardiphaga sp. TaxID=1926292 RepID=UPI0037DA74AD
MADRTRNEIDFVVGENTRVMRATVDAMLAIEGELGKSLMRVVQEFTQVDYGMRTLTSVIFHGLKGGENKVSPKEVAEDILAIGTDQAAYFAMKFLNVAMNGQTLGKPEEAAASL